MTCPRCADCALSLTCETTLELKTVTGYSRHAGMEVASRVIATGVRDSNLKDQATVKHEFDLIGGSLLLSFAIGPLLSPQTTCADGSECPVILALDMLCWATLSTCLLLCVVSSWSMVAIEQCVSTEAMARWAYENWPFYNMGAGLMVTSFTFLPFALATRAVILLHGNPHIRRGSCGS